MTVVRVRNYNNSNAFCITTVITTKHHHLRQALRQADVHDFVLCSAPKIKLTDYPKYQKIMMNGPDPRAERVSLSHLTQEPGTTPRTMRISCSSPRPFRLYGIRMIGSPTRHVHKRL